MSTDQPIPFSASSSRTLIRVDAIGLARCAPPASPLTRETKSRLALVHCVGPLNFAAHAVSLRCAPGSCVLLPISESSQLAIAETSTANWLVFPEDTAVSRLAADHGIFAGQPFALGRADFVSWFFSEIQDELERRDIRHAESIDLLVRRLFLFLERHRAEQSGKFATPRMAELSEKIVRLRERISASIEDTWTVSRMAAELHVSRTHFMRLYREFVGRPPMVDLIDLRLQEARKLLVSTTLPITQISYDCGFHSHTHFARQFRKRFGCAPSVFAAKSIARPARAA